MVAPCNARGVLRGDAVPAVAEFLPEAAHDYVEGLMGRKYRVDRVLILPVYRLAMKLLRKPARLSGETAYLAITPT
jgi:hypothetical protein